MRNEILFLFGLVGLVFILFSSNSQTEATITILRDAGSLTIGTVPNERHESSSVTMRSGTPIGTQNEGGALSDINTINCVGDGVDCTVSGGTLTVNVSTGVGTGTGASVISTFTWVIKAGGDVYLSTNSFIPIPGAYGVVGKSTINVIEVQPFTLYASSVGWTSFNVAICTQTLGFATTWYYGIKNSTVGVNSKYGVWVSTAFRLYKDWAFSLHTTSVTTAPGAVAAEYGMKMRGWVDSGGGN